MLLWSTILLGLTSMGGARIMDTLAGLGSSMTEATDLANPTALDCTKEGVLAVKPTWEDAESFKTRHPPTPVFTTNEPPGDTSDSETNGERAVAKQQEYIYIYIHWRR
jgi:hypothetical protein